MRSTTTRFFLGFLSVQSGSDTKIGEVRKPGALFGVPHVANTYIPH